MIPERDIKQDYYDMFKFYGTTSLIVGLYMLILSTSFSPKIKGQNPVVENNKGCVVSFGYDFDKDGDIDYAQQWAGSGRTGCISHEIKSNELEYKILQESYSKQEKIKNK